MASTLTPEQKRVLARIEAIGAQLHATPMEEKSAVETGLVESNLTNPSGGDADSAGWRQERASLYPDPTNLDASIRRYFQEAAGMRGKYGNAGDLAAAVQRPAAQYRGRYAQVSALADRLLGGAGGAAGDSQAAPPTAGGGFDQAGYEQARRRAILGQFLAKDHPDSLLFKAGVLSPTGAAPNPADFTTASSDSGSSGSAPAAAAGAPKVSTKVPAGRVGHFERTQVPSWMLPALRYARANGWTGSVTSGVRTRAEQERLYANRASNPNPVAAPGTSNHEIANGGAIDVSDPDGFAKALTGFKGRKPVRDPSINDPVHFSANGR